MELPKSIKLEIKLKYKEEWKDNAIKLNISIENDKDKFVRMLYKLCEKYNVELDSIEKLEC